MYVYIKDLHIYSALNMKSLYIGTGKQFNSKLNLKTQNIYVLWMLLSEIKTAHDLLHRIFCK